MTTGSDQPTHQTSYNHKHFEDQGGTYKKVTDRLSDNTVSVK
jgi:hypothetical protein